MRCFLKPCSGVLIALMLVLTGQSLAVARGASAATGQMVICIGTEAVSVYVDAEGNPTDAPHFCPDCVLSFYDGPVPPRAVFLQSSTAEQKWNQRHKRLVPAEAATGFRSRAPPVDV